MRKDSRVVVGVDLGDRWSEVYAVSVETGQVVVERRVATTREGLGEALEGLRRARVVMEASTQSAWVSRAVERMGHEAVVANPRAVRLIYADTCKDDRLDAAFCDELLSGMEPMEDVIRASGQYGQRVPVSPDADVQTRLLGFIGRDPAWTP